MGDMCLECRTLISNSVFCECDMCGRKIHSSCANLSISDIKFLRSISKKFLKGLCEQCRDEIHLLPILYKRVQDLEDIFENNDIATNYDKLVVDNNSTDSYKKEIHDEIEYLQNKLESLSRENEILNMESKTSNDKLILVLNLLEENKTETNRVIYYLESTLENIKDENNRLKLKLSKKELLIELKDKFYFQTVRKLEKDNEKLVEEHENIKKYMKKKYNNIRLKYLKEVEKVSLLKQDFFNLNSKYQEMNLKYHEQINNNMKYRQDKIYQDALEEKLENLNKDFYDEKQKYQENNISNNQHIDSLKFEQVLSINDNKEKPRIKKEQVNGETICNFMYIISECCNELNLSFTKFVEQWTSKIQIENEKSPSLRLCQFLEMDDVFSIIIDNINAVILLLNNLSSSPLTMEGNIKYNQDNHLNPKIEVIEPKAIKKFTLRPSKLHTKVLITPDSKETLKSDDISQNCKPFDLNGQGENGVSNTHLPLLSFDLQIQDAFPHISDTFLDKLGLLENNPKVKLTKEDTEDLFTTLAVQVEIDSKDIKAKLEKQKEICSQQHRKLIYLLKDVSLRLRDHRCIGASDSINPVFIILEDVRFQMQEMMQAVGQLGVLTCEDRMTKCWNLVTNYMAKSSENLQKKSSPNKFTPKCDKTSDNESSICENVQKQHLSVKRINKCPRTSSWCSRFTYILAWLSFISLLFLIGLIIVHWQCRMNTISRICPLDDFTKILSTNIGNPPY